MKATGPSWNPLQPAASMRWYGHWFHSNPQQNYILAKHVLYFEFCVVCFVFCVFCVACLLFCMLFLVYLISHWSSGFFFFKCVLKWWFMTSTCSMLVCLYQIRPIFRQNFSFRPRAITETQHCSGDDEVIISIRCVSRNITHQAKFSLNSILRICNRRQHMQ